MSHLPLSGPAAEPQDQSEVIDSLADEFEAAWKARARPEIAPFLLRVAPELRPRLADELVRLDIEYRAACRETRSVAEYVRQISDLDSGPKAIAELEAFAAEMERKHATLGSDPLGVTSADDTPIPTTIGKYPIFRRIQSGGQADVYLGEHPVFKNQVAIKLGHHSEQPGAARDRFIREAAILTEITHPHIARVYDMDFHEGRPFLAMEYIRGRSLQQKISESPGWRESARLVAQAASALQAVHARGVLHLDVTPKNVMVDETGSVKLIDFGLARLRSAWEQDPHHLGVTQGTPVYLSPEQAIGDSEHLDPRTDVFGLGAILYGLLSGHAPYSGSDLTQVLTAARAGRIDLQSLKKAPAPAWLKRICRRAMAKEPKDRYASAGQLEAALRRGLFLWPKGFLAAAATVVLGVLIALAIVLWKPWARHDAVAAIPSADPTLAIYRQNKDGDFRKVTGGLTVTEQDRFYVESNVPPNLYAAMVLFSPGDPPHIVQQLNASDPVRELRYPPLSEGKDAVLHSRNPGTALILVLTSATGPITAADIQGPLTRGAEWPILNPDSTIRFNEAASDYVEKSRDFGTIDSQHPVNPDEATRQRLDALRYELMAKYPAFQGVAFRHQPSPNGT